MSCRLSPAGFSFRVYVAPSRLLRLFTSLLADGIVSITGLITARDTSVVRPRTTFVRSRVVKTFSETYSDAGTNCIR